MSEYRLKVLSNLTDSLLEYSRLTEDTVPIELERINVNNVLRDSVSIFYEQFIIQDYEVKDASFDLLLIFADLWRSMEN